MKKQSLKVILYSVFAILFLAGCTQNEEENPIQNVDSSIDEEAGVQTLKLSLMPTLKLDRTPMFGSNSRVAGDASGTFKFDSYQAYMVVEEVVEGVVQTPALLDKKVPYTGALGEDWDELYLTVPLYKDIKVSTYIVHNDYNFSTSDPHTTTWAEFSEKAADMVFFFGETATISTPVASDIQLDVMSQLAILDVTFTNTNINMDEDNVHVFVTNQWDESMEEVSITTADKNLNRFYFADYEGVAPSEWEDDLKRDIEVVHDIDGDESPELFLVGKYDVVLASGEINNLRITLPDDYSQGAYIEFTGGTFHDEDKVDIDIPATPE